MQTDEKVRSVKLAKTGIRVQARGIIAGLDASRSAPVLTMGGTCLFVGPAQQPRYHICAPAFVHTPIRPWAIGKGADCLWQSGCRAPTRTAGWKTALSESPHLSRSGRKRPSQPCSRPPSSGGAKQEHRKGRYTLYSNLSVSGNGSGGS